MSGKGGHGGNGGDFLATMAAGSRARAEAAKRELSEAALAERAVHTPRPPRLALHPRGFDLIAELKLRSPAAGKLRDAGTEDVGARVTAYARAGAAAVSVLTEPERFDGSLEHLVAAARSLAPLGVPAMRKDFLVDPYQVTEARAAGAGGVLVILRMLPVEGIEALVEAARRWDLFVLLEAFDEADIDLAHRLLAKYARAGTPPDLLIGVNCRDLVTLQVVQERLFTLAPLLPSSAPRVAESGVATAADACRCAAAGYDLALVGSALMTAGDDPGVLARAMLDAGRSG